jgi:protein-disulfide isomerase
MASRKEQKEQARQKRLAQERIASDRAQRSRRLRMLAGVVATAVVVIVVAIVISSSGGGGGATVKPHTTAATAAVKHVDTVLAGIPQSGTTLGKSSAPVTITEYEDLECSVCDVLATPTSYTNPEAEKGSGWEDELISQYVRTGKAKLVYKSLETASSGNPDQNAFREQQIAAYAAGKQNKAWDYIELMYNEQGQEGANYVTENYLQGLAKQIRGLNFKQWMTDRKLASLSSEVSEENAAGSAIGGGSTPTVVIKGPAGIASPIIGLPQNGYNAYVSAIKLAS